MSPATEGFSAMISRLSMRAGSPAEDHRAALQEHEVKVNEKERPMIRTKSFERKREIRRHKK
ncbi:MAG TPA: hypothetical protein VFG44_11920 [Burkholderiales bacterium]|nr:hypothetical protein [Burkholderiales bacterium]